SRDPAGGDSHQFVPIRFKGKLEFDAHDAVVKIFHPAQKPLTAGNRNRVKIFHHRRALESHVLWRWMRETRLARGRPGSEHGAQLIELDLLRDIVKHKDRKRSAHKLHTLFWQWSQPHWIP